MSTSQHTGQAGTHAADETKGAFQELNTATEDIRKNVNSFADELLGGNKSTHSTAGGTGDVHPDAKKAGDGIAEGVGAAAGKLGQATGSHKH